MNELPINTNDEFQNARAEWEQVFLGLFDYPRHADQWVDWLNMSYDNLSPDDDSAVVLSKRHRSKDIGFSVHLCLHDDKNPPVTLSHRVFGETTADPVRHFVIATEVSPSAKHDALQALKEWLNEPTSQ